MDKLEKVIRGLECCEKKVCIFKDTEKECPYWELCGEYESAFEDCTTALAKDALALLKAQEPKPPIVKENSYGWKFYYCPSCGKEFYQNNKFITVDGNGRARSNAYIEGQAPDVGADLFRRGLCLPSDNKMTPEQQDAIIKAIHKCFE